MEGDCWWKRRAYCSASPWLQSRKKQRRMFWPLIVQGRQIIKTQRSRQRFKICKSFEPAFLCSSPSTQLDSFEQKAAKNDAHRKLLWLSQQVSHIPTCNTISELFHFVLSLVLSICCVDCTHLHHFLSSQPHQFAESCKFSLFYPPGKTDDLEKAPFKFLHFVSLEQQFKVFGDVLLQSHG